MHSQKNPSHENYFARLEEEEESMQSGDKRGCSNVRDKNVGASGVKSQQMLWRKFARLISWCLGQQKIAGCLPDVRVK